MSNLTTSLHLFGGSGHRGPGLPNLLSEALHRIGSEIRARRAARQVETLSDEALRDIGITRSEIDSAVRFGRYRHF